MKTKYNNQRQDRHSFEQSNTRSKDDFKITEPAQDSDLTLPNDDDDELSDYSLLNIALDSDYEGKYQ